MRSLYYLLGLSAPSTGISRMEPPRSALRMRSLYYWGFRKLWLLLGFSAPSTAKAATLPSLRRAGTPASPSALRMRSLYYWGFRKLRACTLAPA